MCVRTGLFSLAAAVVLALSLSAARRTLRQPSGSGDTSAAPDNFVCAMCVLKIDGELVRNLGDCVEDRIVVESLARIATELGKTTVAKFVEDDATRDLVRSYGLDYAQGYGIGRPQPVSEWLSLDAPPAAIAAPTHP